MASNSSEAMIPPSRVVLTLCLGLSYVATTSPVIIVSPVQWAVDIASAVDVASPVAISAASTPLQVCADTLNL